MNSPKSKKSQKEDATEQNIHFFEEQHKIYPKRVWGKFRKLKWISMVTLLAIYYLVPFLRWDRGPHAPNQAILIDMPNRRAYFFFIEIWPQEVYYLTGILILAAVALFFVTSLFGRVWCGYACPQTVWTDLFIWVERLVQGDRTARMRLDKAPWSFNKIIKKLTTHAIWLLIAALTGGAWVLYFNDALMVLDGIVHWDLPWTVTGWILALTGSTYLMAGYAREQVCIYMCPYSRFQSAMFDPDTLIIGYDSKRGEPRGKHKKGESWEGRGHCVNCNQCVEVCPMGIDIRNGLQLECIACGLCVDACNNIMSKVGLEPGLIRYDTARNMAEKHDDHKFRLIRPRTIYYALILALVGGVMLFSLIHRSPLELHVLHDRNPLYVLNSDGTIRNGYTIKILNKTHDDRTYRLTLEGLENASLRIQGVGETTADRLPVFADSVGHFRVFVNAAKQNADRSNVIFVLTDNETSAKDEQESVFISDK